MLVILYGQNFNAVNARYDRLFNFKITVNLLRIQDDAGKQNSSHAHLSL